ncbi:MAG: glycosyltransferase, partial [Rothia dentocariosa]|nr:glycosyltransferase [Rothia dentocariosa]
MSISTPPSCVSSETAARVVHVFSMHTDPFAQPGSGDAGGMNVYIARSVEAMLAADPALRIEVFTLDFGDGAAERSAAPEHPRCRVHYVPVSGTRGAAKNDLPKFTGGFAQAAVEAAQWVPQLIHAHYWLSGVAALNAAAHYATATAGSRTNVPVLFTPHTTAAAKDAHRGANEPAEPGYRRAEEGRIIAEANLIIANTPVEADQLQGYYGADPSRLRVITPGVDTSIFCPVAGVHAENEGSDTRSRIVFAGRPQPLKGPHLLVEALGLLP